MWPVIIKELVMIIAPEAIKAGWKFLKKKFKRKPKIKNLYR